MRDTVDLCPGNCGASIEQFATVPFSQWEATGISGDIPFTVEFSPYVPPFTIPAGTTAPPTATPPTAPKTTAPKTTPPIKP